MKPILPGFSIGGIKNSNSISNGMHDSSGMSTHEILDLSGNSKDLASRQLRKTGKNQALMIQSLSDLNSVGILAQVSMLIHWIKHGSCFDIIFEQE